MSYEYYIDTTSSSTLTVGSSITYYQNYCWNCFKYYIGWHTCHGCNCNKEPRVVYKYQITCPKCETKAWAELDESFKCVKCKSKILVKAKKEHDFEVEV